LIILSRIRKIVNQYNNINLLKYILTITNNYILFRKDPASMNINHPKSVDDGQDVAAGSEELQSPGDTELGHIAAHPGGHGLAG